MQRHKDTVFRKTHEQAAQDKEILRRQRIRLPIIALREIFTFFSTPVSDLKSMEFYGNVNKRALEIISLGLIKLV